jgi:PAS domain S-box-containing protein
MASQRDKSETMNFQLLVDSIPTLIHTALPNGEHDYFNQSWLDYVGMTLKDLSGWKWSAAIHPEDVRGIVEQWRAALVRGKPFEHEARVRRADGEYRWMFYRNVPLLDERGNVVKWYGSSVDIEDRKQSEQKLRQSDRELRQLIDAIPQHVVVLEPDGRIRYVNQVGLDYTGHTLEETLAKDGLARTFHPDDVERVQGERRNAISRGAPAQVEARIRGADGRYRWFLIRVNPLRDEQGRILRWYGTRTDIEDRKQAEESLRRSEAYLAEAQRLSHTGSWAFDLASNKYVYVSEEVFRIFEMDAQEGPPNREAISRRIHPEDWDRVQGDFEKSLREKVDISTEFRIVLPSGTVKHIQAIRHPVLNDAGDVVRLVGTVIDMTERKRAEEALRRTGAYLAEAQRLTHTGSWAWDSATRQPLHWSEEMFRIFGLNPQEGVPSAETYWQRIHPEDFDRTYELLMKAARGNMEYEHVHRIVLPDGTVKHIHAIGHPALDENGQVTEYVGTAVDVTEQYQSRAALEKAFEEIKALKDQLYKENLALRDEVDRASMFEEIVGTSPALQSVLARVAKVAPMDSTILLTGETGTGKELVARAIHKRSPRSSRAFVSVNCAAVPRDLIASELFGHEKGAFTGATQQRLGRFELAEGGTILLDEVGELPAETQIALLRVLQEHEFERVGGTRTIPSDVRVIAATNRDLVAAIAAGTFRLDLFYRLNVFPIEIPPLRERKEDIPLLVEYFIDRYARKAGKIIRRINRKSLELLRLYPWPGNIRELQNVIERSVIVCETETLAVDERWLSRGAALTQSPSQPLARKLVAEEQQLIEAALAETRGRVSGPSGAAVKLGIPASTLESKIRSLRIDKYRFRSG